MSSQKLMEFILVAFQLSDSSGEKSLANLTSACSEGESSAEPVWAWCAGRYGQSRTTNFDYEFVLYTKKNGIFKAVSQAPFTRKDFISEKEKGTCTDKTGLERQKEQPILCIVC